MDISGPVLIKEGLWWVGDHTSTLSLRCNPYLLMDGGSVILFEPGSVLDAAVVMEKIKKLVPIEKIGAIVVSHQDPDLCSAIPIFEKNGFSGSIYCHERAATLIAFYGISSPFQHVNIDKYRYKLSDGTFIHFIYAPYLHFPAAIMTYLPRQKALISGDLFGASSTNWTLYAQDDYKEAMKTFHETYMPSHEILQSVMNQLLHYDIDIICSQHGSIIDTKPQQYIEILRELPCGMFLQPLRKDMLKEGGVLVLCNLVLKRYFALFGSKEIHDVFDASGFTIDYQEKAIEKTSFPENQMWDEFFNRPLEVKGMQWITIISAFVENLSRQYTIPLPKVYESLIFNVQKKQEVMNSRYQKLELEEHLKGMEDGKDRCPITGLYNQTYFEQYTQEKATDFLEDHKNPFALLMLSIDNLSDINLDFTHAEGDATMRNVAYIITQLIGDSQNAFRLEGSVFAIIIPKIDHEAAIAKANLLRNSVSESEMFIVPITISLGMFHSDEITWDREYEADDLKQIIGQTTRFRLRLAKKQGRNMLVSDSKTMGGANSTYTVLLVDSPGIQRDMIHHALEREGYQVVIASDGLEARHLVDEELPDIIISEVMTAKVGVFTLRKELLLSPSTKDIPFILLSAKKNEDAVERAMGLGIVHFFQRPVMLVELLGVIRHIISEYLASEA